MRLFSVPMLLALLVFSSGASAQMYKWVDDKGVTHFSDQPAPASAKKSEVKSTGSSGDGPALPYELALAVRNAPVTMYTMSGCPRCDQGRSLLQARGVPFTEKTINTADDQARLTAAGGDGTLPFLMVGGTKINGFETGAWNGALNNASYPTSKMLPANYKNPGVESAAAPKGPTPAQLKKEAERLAKVEAEAAAAEAARLKRLPPVNAPPNFQF
jgi:glutaredoxin